MIKDIPIHIKTGKLNEYIPSKETVKEYVFFIVSGFLLARVDFMGVISSFGYAWLITMFLSGRNTLWGTVGIIAGRISVLNFDITNIALPISDILFHLGGWALLSALGKIRKGVGVKVYAGVGVAFYIAAISSFLVIYDATLYNILYAVLNVVTVSSSAYAFYRCVSLRSNIDFRNISGLDVILIVAFVTLAVMGVGYNVVFSVDVRMVLMYAIILISAYSYGAGTGALIGTVFGILLGVEGHYTLVNIIPFTVCGVACGILYNTSKIVSAMTSAVIYMGLFFLLEYNTTDIHIFAELFLGCVLYVIFPGDVLSTVRDALHSEGGNIISTKAYADRVKMICCEKIDGVCRSTDRLHGIIRDHLKNTERVSVEQIAELTDNLVRTVCPHCVLAEKCMFATENGKKNPSCEVAGVINSIHRLGNNWRMKMSLYRDVPAITVGCMSDSVNAIKHKLENTVKINNILSTQAEHQCKLVCKYVDGVAVLNDENGYEVIVQLKTTSLSEDYISKIRSKCEDIMGVGFELADKGDAILSFTQKSKYVLSTGIVSVPLEKNGICGDAGKVVSFGKTGYMLAVADGCGTGYTALAQSGMAMELFETMAQCSCDESTSVSLINTLMGLRMDDDRYSTADICVFNKYNGNTKFIKMGAVCSFIVHNGAVTTVKCGSGALGMTAEASECVENYKLRSGDTVVMMTDGVYEACGGYNDPNDFFKDSLGKMRVTTAQQTAQKIMDNAMRNLKKQKDDMLVLVATVKRG